MPPSRWSTLVDLARPLPLAATALLVANDHLLKGSGWIAGAVTGKLSDLAGLFVAGIAAVCGARLVAGSSTPRDGHLARAALAAVAIGFAALKLSPSVNAAVNRVWGHHVLDATDVWCLPILGLSWLWLRDRASRDRGEVGHRLATVAATTAVVLACAATPAPRPVPPPPLPMWSIPKSSFELPCGTAEAWVAKSGKTGFGVTVKLTAKSGACPVTIAARLHFVRKAVGTVHGHEVASDDPQQPANVRFYYLAIEFDNDAEWKRGERSATLELLFDDGARPTGLPTGDPRSWRLPATHAISEFPARRR